MAIAEKALAEMVDTSVQLIFKTLNTAGQGSHTVTAKLEHFVRLGSCRKAAFRVGLLMFTADQVDTVLHDDTNIPVITLLELSLV